MPNSVDSRVVQMQFDNAQFEQGVMQTMSSLQKLDGETKKLSGAEKGIGRLKDAMSNFNVGSAISTGIHGIGSAFASVADIGISAFDSITSTAITGLKVISLSVAGLGAAIAGMALHGGINRAMNIEQAKFQLKGLGIAWSDIEDDINHGVKGTAYGLDSAAKAASQFAASGVEVGDSMKAALRGISGVAAMTSSDYDSIANVFTAVSGQGKVMTQQLRMLELRGMNAAASMAEYFTKVNNGSIETTESVKKSVAEITGGTEVTEAAVRDLVTKGLINFDVFSHAMDDTFGLHAKKANETFTGAMSNVKAALSRIGANFAASGMEALRQVFVKLIPAIDGVNSALKPFYNIFEAGANKASESAQNLIGNLIQIREEVDDYGNVSYKFEAFKGPLADAIEIFENLLKFPTAENATNWNLYSGALKNVVDILGTVKQYVGAGLDELFPEDAGSKIKDTLLGITEQFGKFTSNLKLSGDTIATYNLIKYIFQNLATIIKNIVGYFKPFTNSWNVITATFKTLAPSVENVFRYIERLTKKLADLTTGIQPSNKAMGAFNRLIWQVGLFISNIAPVVEKVLGAAFTGLATVVNIAGTVFVAFVDILGNVFKKINESAPFLDTLKTAIGGISDFLQGLFPPLTELEDHLEGVNGTVVGFGDFLIGVAQNIQSTFPIFQGIADRMGEFVNRITEPFKGLTATDLFAGLTATGVVGLATFITSLIKQMVNLIKNVKGDLGEIFEGGLLKGVLGKGVDQVSEILGGLGDALEAFTNQANAGALISIAGAIAILTLSLALLSTLSWEDVGKGVVGIAALGGILVGMSKLISMIDFSNGLGKSLIRLGLSFVLIAFAIGGLVNAVRLLGREDPETLITGLLALTGILTIVGGAAVLLSKYAAQSTAGAGAIGTIGAALMLLIIPMKVFGSMSVEDLVKGFVTITGLLLVLTASAGALAAIGGRLLSVGPAMLLAATSLIVLTGAIAILSLLNPDGIAVAIMALGGGMGILALGLYAMKGTLGGALAMIVAASGIIALTGAILVLSALDPVGMGYAIMALGAALLMLSVGMWALKGLGTAAPTLVLAAAALTMLAVPIALLSSIPALGLVAALIALAGAFVIMGVAATLLQPLTPAILALSGAMLTFSISISSLGFSLAAAGFGIMLIADYGVKALSSLGEGFISFATYIANAGPQLEAAGTTSLQALANSIANSAPEVGTSGASVLFALVNALMLGLPSLVVSGISMIVSIIRGIASGIGAIIQAGFELAIAFINGLADAIASDENQASLLNAIENLVGAILDALWNFITKGLPDIGGKILDGLAGIFTGDTGEVVESAGTAGAEAATSFEESVATMPETAQSTVADTSASFDGLIGDLQAKTDVSAITEGFDLSALPLESEEASQGVIENFNLDALAGSGTEASAMITEGFDLSALSDTTESSMSDVSSIISGFGDTFNADAKSAGDKATDGLGSGMSGMKNVASDKTGAAISAVRSKSGEASSAGDSIGANMGSSMAGGISRYIPQIEEAARRAIRSAKTSAENEAQIKSPSRVFSRIGMFLDLGLVAGMENYKNRVEEAGRDVSKAAINSAMVNTAYLANALDGLETTPVIRPVFDDSLVRAGVSSMNGYFARNSTVSAAYLGSRSGSGFLFNDTANSNTVVNITLNPEAGSDANAMAMMIGQALKSRNLLEA